MTAAEFRTWLERRELSDADAAPLLRAKRHEVWRWRTGERAVPGKVERIVELMDELAAEQTPEMRALRTQWEASARSENRPYWRNS